MIRLEKLQSLMSGWGLDIAPQHYFRFEHYTKTMLERDRVIVVWNERGFIEAIIFYFLTNDYEKLYKKPMWVVADDEPEGKQIYIDKMVCRKWTRTVRDSIGRALQERFPRAEVLVYHRAPKDRCVKIRRKDIYEPVQDTVS